MPIYEFYCHACNTIFNFFSKSVNTSKQPRCPRCQGTLKRQVSLFACIGNAKEDSPGQDMPFDESKLERTMGALTREAENVDENDPRAAANLMRKFSEMTGVKLGNGMQEALRRMEAGEDPEKIEAEMGDILESEEPFLPQESKGTQKVKKPLRDETLYEL